MLRRSLLGLLMSAVTNRVAAQQAARPVEKPRPQYSLIIDQSGVFGQPDFVFASWLVPDIDKRKARLLALKKKYRYRRQLQYRSTDRHKKMLAQQVLNDFLVDPIERTRLVFVNFGEDRRVESIEKRYADFLTKEILAAVGPEFDFHVIAQRRFSGGADARIKDLLSANIAQLKSLTYRTEREEPLIQCLGHLTGTAHGVQLTKKLAVQRATNPTKLVVQKHLEKQAGLGFPFRTFRKNSLLVTTRTEK